MHTLAHTHHRTAALRRAAVRATLAPSVHNTQPWRFVLRPDRLEIHADPSRQLRQLDPTGRQLTISCGCAVFNARVALASSGIAVDVQRFPDAGRPDLVASLVATETIATVSDPIVTLDSVIELRQTNRRRFSDDDVPPELISLLQAAALSEGAAIHVVRGEDERLAVAALCQRADAIENLSPAYRAELRAWTTDDPRRDDGVRAMTVPHVDGTAHDDVPMRDFDTRGTGWLPAETRSSRHQCLLVLSTAGDNSEQWLRAGEALERVLLEIARHGYAASPLTQVVEVGATRARLRNELRLSTWPHLLLRVGRAPMTPSARRRRLVDVLDERS